MEKKPTIKYLDRNGDYQYATVKDIGDIDELLTPIKTDLVSAINAIVEGGSGLSQEWIDYINGIGSDLEDVMNSIEAGVFSPAQLAEIQETIDYARSEIERLLSIDYTEKFDQIREEYDGKVQEINNNVDGVTNNLEAAKKSLDSIRESLSDVELNVATVTESVDYVKGELLTKVDSTTFESLESTVKDNSTEIFQNAEEIKLKASQESLDLATQDIQQLQADFSVTAEAIEGTVKKSELIGELEGLDIYPPTLLRGSRDWWEWESTIPARAYVKSETYQHASIQEQVGFNAYLTKELTDLEIGKTYVASVWIKSEATHAKPVFKIGSTNHFMKNNNTSDEFLSNIWQRYSVSFVADKEIVIVGFTTIETVSGDVVQFAGGKVEIGTKSTGWREHEDDNHNRLVVAEATVRQTAEGIAQIVQRQTEIDGEIEEQQTQLNQTSEKIDLQASELAQHGEDIAEMSAQLTVQADAIKSKVSQTDIDKSIGDIKLDNRNGILNSDFSQDFDNWSEISPVFKVIKIGNKNYAQASRTGLTGDIVSTMSSNMIQAKNGQRIMIGMDMIVENIAAYDNKVMFALGMYDINDVRVATKEFKAEDLGVSFQNGVAQRINANYEINREDVAKVQLRLTLYRNGTVSYTNINLQRGDIGSTDWTPAPEDVQAVTAKLSTEIIQTADKIEAKADKSIVDELTGDMSTMNAAIEAQAEQIGLRVTKTEAQGYAKDAADSAEGRVNSKITALSGELKVESDRITAEIKRVDDQQVSINSLTQTAEDTSSIISNQNNELTQIKQSIDEIDLSVVKKDQVIASINASTEKDGTGTLRLKGDRVLIDGDTRFKDDVIMDGGVIRSKDNGINIDLNSGTMNLSRPLTINASPVATKEDLDVIELQEGKSAYEIAVDNGYVGTEAQWLESLRGKDGANGAAGAKGADGKGISSAVVTYQNHTNGSTAPTGTWSSTIPTPIKGQYLWTRTITTYTDNSSIPTYAVAYNALDGQKGSDGATGIGVSSTSVHYQLSTSGNTTPTGTWLTTVPTPVKGQYLWTRTVVSYTNGTSSTAYSTSYYATDGQKGDKGDTGAKGSDGISPIVGFLTNESITLPASNTGVVSSFTGATGTFNVYEGTTLKNTQASYSVVSPQSNITVSITQSGVYTVSAMTTGASVLSGTATLRAVYGGITIDKILTVTKALAGSQGATGSTGATGETGSAGQNATTYWINASTNAIKKDVTGTIVPSIITFSGFSKTGTSNPVAYAGRFIIQTSTDGVSYTTAYTSSANQASYTYTVPTTASFVKARYYLAGGTSVLLDEQTIPVLVDAEGIDKKYEGQSLLDKTEILSGTEIYTDKADDSVVHVEIDGKSVGGGSGKNLLIGYNRETLEVFNDSTSERYIYPSKSAIRLKPNTTYTLSGEFRVDVVTSRTLDLFLVHSGGTQHRSRNNISLSTSWVKHQAVLTTGDGTEMLMNPRFDLNNISTPDSVTMYARNIQLEEGSSLTDFELPAPTPDYPIEIHSLNDFGVVSQKSEGGIVDGDEIGGRNYFVINEATENRLLVWASGQPSSETGSLISGFIPVYANEKIISSSPTSQVMYYDADKNHISMSNITGGSNFVVVNNNNIAFMRVSWRGNFLGGRDKEDIRIKIEKGNKATDWTPAPEDITENDNHPLINKTNILLSEPLRSVGDVKDRLFRDSDGLWKVERNVGEKIFTGGESFTTAQPTDNTMIRFSYTPLAPETRSGYNNVLSNYFKTNKESAFGAVTEESIDTHPSSGIMEFFIKKARLSTNDSAGFKSWLMNNHVTVHYVLANPIIEILSQEFQDKLNNIVSYKDSNYVYTIVDKTNILPEYVRDNLKPTLHATFKGGGWYSRFKTEQGFNQTNKSVDSLKNETIPSLKDGLLNSSEKEAVKQSLNVVSADKKGIDTQYTTVYANTALTGTAKTNLNSAKVALNTAFANLQVAISAVLGVGDGTRITTAQMTLVTTRLNEYGTALSTYNQRYEQAQDAISTEKKRLGDAYALAQATLAETQAKAHADGKVTAEEQRAIADAQAKLTEAQNHARGLVDGLEIGGRNLVFNSDFQQGQSHWYINGNASLEDTEKGKAMLLKPGSTGFYTQPQHLEVGSIYTVSFDAKSNSATLNSAINFGFLNQPAGKSATRVVGASWQRVTLTISNALTAGGTLLHFYATSATGTHGVYVKNIKVEKGNKATDWTPAPEDIAQEIADKADNSDLLEVISRVDNAELKISDSSIISTVTQSATYRNALTGKVSVGEIISRINQSAEAISINANKINLSGAVTISSFGTSLKTDFETTKSNSSIALNRADNAKSKTDAWSYQGTTEIDGALIKTGTIKANSINATEISSITSNLGNVTAGRIRGGGSKGNVDINLDTGVISSSAGSGTSRMNINGGVAEFVTSSGGGTVEYVANISTAALDLKTRNSNGTEISNVSLNQEGILMSRGYSKRVLGFTQEGLSLRPGDSNTGTDRNSGIELVGEASYIDFHNSTEPVVDFGARIIYASWNDVEMLRFQGAEKYEFDSDIYANQLFSNGNQVVSSGSNSNGHWIRYYDGTQICWRSNIETTPINIANGAVYRSGYFNYNFPATFVTTTVRPVVTVSAADAWAVIMNQSPTEAVSVMLYKGTSESTITTRIHYTAIGRWK